MFDIKLTHLTLSEHKISEERDILAWLHNNKKIDASLCMIEDTEDLSFKKYLQHTAFRIYNKINR